ncbi:MAG: DUF1150 family protein [Pseudomonadota bacterium]
MTHDTAEANARQPIVYIRKVAVSDLPADLQERVEGVEALYAIGNEDGKQLALVKDRHLAFVVARQNDFSPVSVH